MSGIPSNMNALGSIMQAQVSAKEKAKTDQARESQEAEDSRRIARLTQQQTDEVEETEATDDVYVRREDERTRDNTDARDTWEHHKSKKIYHTEDENQKQQEAEQEEGESGGSTDNPSNEDGGNIIDVSV